MSPAEICHQMRHFSGAACRRHIYYVVQTLFATHLENGRDLATDWCDYAGNRAWLQCDMLCHKDDRIAPKICRTILVHSKQTISWSKKADKCKDAPELSNSMNLRNKSGAFLDCLSKFTLSNF